MKAYIPKHGWKIDKHSFSKMIVWFKDGNIRTFHSYDWQTKFSRNRDQELGLDRLKNLALKYGDKAKTIEIYDRASCTIIGKFINGVEIKIKGAIKASKA